MSGSSATLMRASMAASARSVPRLRGDKLCKLACGFGEAAGLPGIDLCQRQPRRAQRLLQIAVIGPCRLMDDPGDRRFAEPSDQRLVSSFRVVKALGFAIRKAMNVEKVFRNIHADGRKGHLFRAFACHPGHAPWYPFRPKEKTGAITL